MGMFLITMIQIVGEVLLWTWMPEWMSDFSFMFLAQMLLMYLLGMPLMLLLIMGIKPRIVIPREKQFVTIILNPGMMVFIAMNVLDITLQLLVNV